MERIGLTPFSTKPYPSDSPWLDSEHAVLKMMVNFSTTLASNLMWAHICYSYNFPHVIALLLKPNAQERKMALNYLKEMVTGIQRLEKEHLKLTGKKSSAITSLYDDLAFQKMPLSREVMIMLLQTNFEENAELRQLAAALYASSSSTKDAIFCWSL